MAVTTVQQEYKRLRSYLNPYIKGKNTDAILTALATGSSSYLINNAAAVNDQLYITTASGDYLDQRLADFGITRPPFVGLEDDEFRQIGIQIKNRKQVRDLINNILQIIFGDENVRASNKARAFEPYNLIDGDTLIVNFDDTQTVTVTFKTNEFQNIATATAQEVADAITKTLRTLGVTGSAVSNNDGNGNYVELISSTIGPASSVTIMGGSSENKLLFDSPVAAGGNASTQWTLSLQPGGIVRFTWSGGANPKLGKVLAGDYVNIFGGGFSSSSNEGSYTITTSVGGLINTSYFEVENPLATSGIITQGTDNALLFFHPMRHVLADLSSYAAVYQTETNVLQIFMPAVTKVVKRSRIGSAHLHDPQNEVFTFKANPNNGDTFSFTTITSLVAGVNFTIGISTQITIANMIAALSSVPGIDPLYAIDEDGNDILVVYQSSPSVTFTGTYTGSSDISVILRGDPISVQPEQQGPYMFDTKQSFTVSDIHTTLSQNLDATMPRVFQVADASKFPDSEGFLVFDYGFQGQEGPVPYIARPSSNTLLLSPTYTIKNRHQSGANVFLVSSKAPVEVSKDGLDYPFYITDVVSGRIYAQDLITTIVAAGINVVFTIFYPNDIGLGKWGTKYTEIPVIYGP